MSFELKHELKNEESFVSFAGYIDEEALFPEVSLAKNVYIDLGEVKSINSIGIRSWLQWFQKWDGHQFIFTNCPKAVVMQMNMVEGFFPATAQILSLEVPFYCEECDEEVNKIFQVGKEIVVHSDKVELKYDKGSICPDGNSPELDVNESKYFRFLLSQYGQVAA